MQLEHRVFWAFSRLARAGPEAHTGSTFDFPALLTHDGKQAPPLQSRARLAASEEFSGYFNYLWRSHGPARGGRGLAGIGKPALRADPDGQKSSRLWRWAHFGRLRIGGLRTGPGDFPFFEIARHGCLSILVRAEPLC